MKMFKKLCLTISGSLGSVVDRLQNHEALAVASLGELEDRIHGARTALASLTRGLKHTDEEVAKTSREAAQWRARAKEKAESGEREVALQCLQRARLSEKRSQVLEQQRASSQAAHQRLQQTLNEMQTMHATLALKIKELRLREQCQGAEGLFLGGTPSDPAAMVNRWEDALGGVSENLPEDPLLCEFERNEQKAELEVELARLLGN
jgi:phage shock protein A